MSNTNKRYDAEFKAKVLKEAAEAKAKGTSRSAVAKANGIADNTIAYWQKQAKKASKPKRRKVLGKGATKRNRIVVTAPVDQPDEVEYLMIAVDAARNLGKSGRELLGKWLKNNPVE